MRTSTRFALASQLLGLAAALPNDAHAHAVSRAETYDYVIVGGGVTGLVVANRLTEDKRNTVLVIEAGGDDDNFQQRIPYGATQNVNLTLFWDDIVSEPEPGLGNQAFGVWVAKVLGGGSIVNGMVYDRASAGDYDAWEALGNKGWGWKGLLPYFKKSTTFVPPPAALAKEFGITWDTNAYGKGPLTVAIADFQYPDIKDYFKAFQGAGAYSPPKGGNSGAAIGATWFPNTMDPATGERTQARNSFYTPVSTRPNLHVALRTVANELVFDSGKKLVARGVKVTCKVTGKTRTVYASKEVVLAAGTVNTVQLLQLSGIGPKKVLQEAGIKVKLEHDGVGANFQDHPFTSVIFDISNMSSPNPNSFYTDAAFNASAWKQYTEHKTGPLTQARGNALAFIPLSEVTPTTYQALANKVKNLSADAYLPDVYKGSKKLLKGVKAQRAILARLFQSKEAGIVEIPVPAAGTWMLVGLEKPLSRGVISLNPTNPQGPPKVLYNALTNPIDKSVMAACVRYLRTVWARDELKKFSPVELSPGAQYTDDDELINKMIELGSISPSLSHPSGSCAMMPEDMGGCVSDTLQFYGVDNLSIVDASILPLVPSQHLQATMYAVGEKAADCIKNRR